MDEVVVKKEKPDAGFEIAGRKEISLQKQHQDNMQHSRLSFPASVVTSGKKPIAATRTSSSSSTQDHSPLQQHRTLATGLKKRAGAASTSNAYSLGTRCGEIFVANNAKQWTFVCTFCNKSTRDIGDFICHIKIKHLEESDEPPQQYGNDEYYNDDGDDDAYSQAQDYLDCGNYLDINVHTEPEELNYSNGNKYGNRYAERYQHQPAFQNRAHNNWKASKEQRSEPQPQKKRSQQKMKVRGQDVVQIFEDSDNDVEDILQTHTSHRTPPKSTQPQKQQLLYRTSGDRKPRNGANDARFGNSMDADDEDAPPNNMKNDYADDDFDNQLLLTPTDSIVMTTTGTDGKTKRRQIRGTAYCALCNKTFQYYSLYRNHMIKHSNETPFKCNLCQKGFKSKQAIRYHMNTHQKEAKFKCEVCETGFYTENQFIAHVLTHENENTHPCMVCGKVLRSEKERDIHLAAHTEERPFRCEFCQKLFRLRHHLSNHLKMHRQYRCEYCREEFTSAVHLRKPYACPVCENSPEARAAAENAAHPHINPLQLFDVVMPPTQPTECVDLAEMVSDSDEHGDDMGDYDGEVQGQGECEPRYVDNEDYDINESSDFGTTKPHIPL